MKDHKDFSKTAEEMMLLSKETHDGLRITGTYVILTIRDYLYM